MQQRVDHRPIVPAEDDSGGGVEDGTVDRGAQLGLLREQSPDCRRIAFSDGFFERLHPPFILATGVDRPSIVQSAYPC